jgi:hypothetical protein
MIYEITNKRKINSFILNITGDHKIYDISKIRMKDTYVKNIFETNVLPEEEITFFYDKYYVGVQKIESLSRIHRCVLSKDFFDKMTKKQLEKYKQRSMEYTKRENRKGLIAGLTLDDFKTNRWIEKTLESVPRLDIRIWTPFNIVEKRMQEDIIANVYLNEEGKINKHRYPELSHSRTLSELAKSSDITEKDLQKENIKEVKRVVSMIPIMKGENVLCNTTN